MAKVLFLSLPLAGHVHPSLPLVHELTDRGDEVVYYATDAFATLVAHAGGRYRPYGDGSLRDLRQLPFLTDEMASWLMRTAARVLESDLDAFRAERPDYIVTDSVAPWGQWAARILGVPLVTSISTLAFSRQVLAYAITHGVRPQSASRVVTKMRHLTAAWRLRRGMCRAYGVKGPGVMGSVMGTSDLNIVYTSRHFQPCADSFDDHFQFVGPLIERVETAPFEWELVGKANVVYVSLGTLFNADPAFYRTCFEAFAGEDVQVILSIGSNVSKDVLGTAPANVVVSAKVPQLAVLQRASAFVTHGGMNSVSESLSFGVPMVVVPQMGEQAIVGRRVEQLGAGLYLAKEGATADALRAAVHRLLTEDRFRAQAEMIRRSFAEAGGAPRAADAIGLFTRHDSTRKRKTL
jgi:MGT family glycosyltransferase